MSKWVIGVLALLLLGSSWYVQHQNDKEAEARAEVIRQADVAGQDTAATLTELKSYAAANLGVNVTITLAGAYERAGTQAKAAAAAAQAANSQIYIDAQKACGGRRDSVSQAKCVQDYVSARLVAAPVSSPVPAPKLADFQQAIRSPFWTPDLAGALLLGGAAAVVWAGVGLISARRRRR